MKNLTKKEPKNIKLVPVNLVGGCVVLKMDHWVLKTQVTPMYLTPYDYEVTIIYTHTHKVIFYILFIL